MGTLKFKMDMRRNKYNLSLVELSFLSSTPMKEREICRALHPSPLARSLDAMMHAALKRVSIMAGDRFSQVDSQTKPLSAVDGQTIGKLACEIVDGQTIGQLAGEFVDGQTIGQHTGEFVDGQTAGQLTGEFVDGQTIGHLTGEFVDGHGD
jgi:hypothetical protein